MHAAIILSSFIFHSIASYCIASHWDRPSTTNSNHRQKINPFLIVGGRYFGIASCSHPTLCVAEAVKNIITCNTIRNTIIIRFVVIIKLVELNVAFIPSSMIIISYIFAVLNHSHCRWNPTFPLPLLSVLMVIIFYVAHPGCLLNKNTHNLNVRRHR